MPSTKDPQLCQARSSFSKAAPLDREWLRSEIESFDPTIPAHEAWLPPSSWYTAPEFYRLEQETVFKNNWLIAARSDELKLPGEFVTGNIAGEPYVIVRTETGSLKAFYNVCRHHAAEVAAGSGCLEQFQCPYHGWSYKLDGTLLSAPGLGAVKEFDTAAFGLVPMQVQEWGRLVFICQSEKARNLEEDLSGLKTALDATNYANLKHVERRTYVLECNWKVFVDNYLDGGYHVQHLHKGLAGQLNLSTYTTEIFARYSTQSSSGKGSEVEIEHLHEGQDFGQRIGDNALYIWIYPNLMINRYGSIMDTNWILPIDHNHTAMIFDFYFEETESDDFIQHSLAASEVVQDEDIQISESVQRGLQSSSYNKGRYAKREVGEHQFHCLLAADFQNLSP